MQATSLQNMIQSRRVFAKAALLATVSGFASPLLGQRGTTQYLVKKGDTLSKLARRYGTTVGAIQSANKLSSDLIRIGQRLIIPTAGYSAPPKRLYALQAAHAGIRVQPSLWKTIVVHHSAIKYGNAAKYDATHRRRGMQNGLAYHFVIGNGIDSGDGEIEIGPRWRKQHHGGHLKNYQLNCSSIGICLVGNFEQTRPSSRQIESLTHLIDWLHDDVLKKKTRIAGHKELPGEKTVCPGKYFPLASLHRRYG